MQQPTNHRTSHTLSHCTLSLLSKVTTHTVCPAGVNGGDVDEGIQIALNGVLQLSQPSEQSLYGGGWGGEEKKTVEVEAPLRVSVPTLSDARFRITNTTYDSHPRFNFARRQPMVNFHATPW